MKDSRAYFIPGTVTQGAHEGSASAARQEKLSPHRDVPHCAHSPPPHTLPRTGAQMLASGDWAKRPAPRGLSPTQAAQVWPHRRQGAGAARCAASCACGRENEARGVTSECLHFLTGRECGLSQRSPWVTEITCDKRAPVAWQARARMLGHCAGG